MVMNHNLLANFTSVEISTVIVDEIVEEMFISWEVYQGIFALSRFSLEQSAIDRSLFDRYLQLRRQLELAYCLLLVDPSSQLYNRTEAAEIRQDLPVLSQPNDRWEAIPTRLPEPIPRDRGAEPSCKVSLCLRLCEAVSVIESLWDNATKSLLACKGLPASDPRNGYVLEWGNFALRLIAIKLCPRLTSYYNSLSLLMFYNS